MKIKDIWCISSTGEKYKGVLSENGDWEFFIGESENATPTHEEIMTKWWKDKNGNWVKVVAYCPTSKAYGIASTDFDYQEGGFTLKDWFIGRESTDIPPEEV